MASKLRIVYLTIAIFLATNIAVVSVPGKTTAKKPAPAKTATPAKAPADAAAREVLTKLADTVKSLQSYKCRAYLEGLDTYTKDRQKAVTGNYKAMAEKTGTEVKIADKPQVKRGLYEIKFMKPYLYQMRIIKSDFVPKIIFGTVITYRSDEDPEVWWAKPKISPIAIKRSITKDDSGGALTTNWYNVLLHMIYYAAGNADITLLPDADFEGRKCYVLRYTFDWKKHPTWTHKQPDFAAFGVNDQIKKLLWADLLDIEKQKFSTINYYIDKERMIPLMTEEYIEGEFHWRTQFKDIELGGLKTSDF
jgi:hypothetical protein